MEVPAALSAVVVGASGREAAPDGEHRVKASVWWRVLNIPAGSGSLAPNMCTEPPRIIPPVLPILHDVVDRNLLGSVRRGGSQKLALRAASSHSAAR